MKSTYLLFLSLVIAVCSYAQPGSNDNTFNTFDDGTYENGTGLNNEVYSAVIQVDGKIIVAGQFTSFNGTVRNRIARLNTNGSFDTSFNIGTGFNNNVRITAIQTDGKIIVGGDFSSYNGTTVNRIVRLNTNGSIDANFNSGIGFNNRVYSTTIQSDGKIIVGGHFSSYNGTAINRIARLNADGSIDNSFNPGTGFNNRVYSTTIQLDGKVIVGGDFTSFNGTPINRIARLNSDGSLDTTFNTGAGFNSTVLAIAIQLDGKIIVGGSFFYLNGIARYYIARLNNDGTLDTSFDPQGVFNDWVHSIAIQADGKIIAGGQFTFNGKAKNAIARLNADGSVDASFNPGTGFNNANLTRSIYTAIQPDGKIITGGAFTTFNGMTRNRIARLNVNGDLDLSFNPIPGFDGFVSCTAIQSDGKIVLGGSFTSFNGISRWRIARINLNGSIDTTFNPGTGFDGNVNSIAIQSDGKIIAGGQFHTFNGYNRNFITRLNPDGNLDTTFKIGTGFNDYVNSVAIQTDGKIIVGGFLDSYNGISKDKLARLNSDGSLDLNFLQGGGFNSWVNTIVIQTDGKIVVGGNFSDFGGHWADRIARIDTGAYGYEDQTFSTGNLLTNGEIYSIGIQADGKIVVGGTFAILLGANPYKYIKRLNTNGSLDNSFNSGTGFNDKIRSISIQSDGKIIVGGDFTAFYSSLMNRICRLNTNGTADLSFNPAGLGFALGANFTRVYSTTIQSDRKIIVGGEFLVFNGQARTRIARLNGDCINFAVSNNGNIITSNESGANYQWLNCNNNQPINGATNQSYTAPNNGSYACIVTKNNCSDTTACVTITSTGVATNMPQSTFVIYPNPTNNKFTIENTEPISQITITDIAGKILLQQAITQQKAEIDISSFSNGIYFLNVVLQNNETITKKIIKQ